jgi:hypothetical protein
MVKKPRIVIEMSEDAHKDIKMRAVDHSLSIKKWVLQAIAEKIKVEEKYK